MGKKDKDAQSAISSSTSKMSLDRGRNPKPPRFSLRRIFCRRPSARSMRSFKSNNQEAETRSVVGFQTSNDRGETSRSESRATDRESPQNLSRISMDEMSHQSTHSVQSSQGKKSKELECPLCLHQQTRENFPHIQTCHHRSCRDCLKQYLKIEITESRINIACPECAERFHPNDIKAILDNEALMNKYEEFMMRRVLVLDSDTRWCPAPDCGYAVIAAGCASCPKLRCERQGCGTYFCYHCKQHWHPNQTCDAARAQRMSNVRSSSLSYSHESANSDIKPCPRCGAFIVKMDDGSCNHMTCAVCGAEFCWLCMKEISDLHYLSPSGCTFWGKKPWSRKKKILWQLGTLVGAPVGIALVAGIAVPAMIIGIPVWVGRKLYAKYQHSPKHKRNLIIVGGVLASVVISPVLAGLAVGFGVPILLGYVYGVVPISLCRSGGCGVTTNSSGVRFEFDDDNEETVGVSGPYSGGEVQSIEQLPHINNPSIGPSIGELSLGMTNSLSASGSHMERIGIIHESDRESASQRAIAGNSLTGSLSGSTLGGTSGYQRVDIQADVAHATSSSHKEKRASLSSESANLSLDAKSATISFGDNASTKALAGSICTKDKDNNSAIIPPIETVAVDMVSNVHQPTATSSAFTVTTPCIATESGVSKVLSRHGSPTSSRSVSFMCDEVQEHSGSVKKKKFKLQTMGDSIQEHSTSIHPPTQKKSSIDNNGMSFHGEGSKYGTRNDVLTTKSHQSAKSGAMVASGGNSRSQSTSSDSVATSSSRHSSFNGGSHSLPEVENDRPAGNHPQSLPTETKLVKLVSSTDMGDSPTGFGGAKPKNGGKTYFGSTGTGNSGSNSSSSHKKHRPVNQMESCPSLLYESATSDISLSHSSSATIHNKSPSLGTIPDQPTLTRSKVTVDGQKRVTYESSLGSSSSSMLHSNPSFHGACCRSNSGSTTSSDNSTCELLRKSTPTMVTKMQISDL